MSIRIDPQRCQGHGNCYAYHPELFSPDEEAFAVLKAPAHMSEELIGAARSAADACPERAITVTDAPTTPRLGSSPASA